MLKKTFSLFLSFTLITNIFFVNLALAADLEVDATAAAKYQATLLKTQSGIDQVNITAANANGVSHNKFTNFNVQTSGMILNNSKDIVNTQLAGHVEGNSNLIGGSARLILNEVTSTNRSHINGYMEVAGQKADLIIANPNGITVNGGGFINIPNATLTTGQVNAAGDMLQVRQGDILIEGQGINANNIDSVNFYTKALKLNAKLYANVFKVFTGSSDVSLDGTVTDVTTTESKPEFSIDSTLLGGIYANAITLVGNENGVGINLPAITYAQDQLTLSSQGHIQLGSISATDLTLSSTQNITLNDQVSATIATINAGTTLTNNKLLSTTSNLNINAGTLDNLGTIASGVDENLNILNNAQTTIDAQTLNNSGTIFASDTVTLQNGTVNNAVNAKINATNIKSTNLTALNNSGEIFANSDINLEATTLTNDGLISSQNTLTLQAQELINNSLVFSSNTMNLYATNSLTNNKNANILAVNNLTLAGNANNDKAQTITNDQASIQSLSGSIDIHARTFNNVAAVEKIYTDPIIKNYAFYYWGMAYNPSYGDDFAGLDSHSSWFNVNLLLYGGNVGNTYHYNRNVNMVLSSYDPATYIPSKLLAGKDITFNTDNIYNHNSLISANGDVALSGNVINEGDQFFRTKTFVDSRRIAHPYTVSYSCGFLNTSTCHRTAYWYSYDKIVTQDNTLLDSISSTIQAGGTITGTVNNVGNGQQPIGVNAQTSTAISDTPIKNETQASVTLDDDHFNLPTGENGLFVFNDPSDFKNSVNTNQNYLIETNPKLINLGQFLGTDYMLGQLNLDHETPFLRLGDSYYESKIIENSIYKLTGRGVLEGFGSNQEQFQALMDNALSLRESLNLKLGEKLNEKQIAALDKDIVWMEEKTVKGYKVLVPVVYLASNKDKTKAGSSLLANKINLDAKGTITNSGTIEGETVTLKADTIDNIQGTMKAKDLTLQAQNNINNVSGTLNAQNMNLQALQGSITSRALYNAQHNNLGNQATIIADNLNMQANQDINFIASKVDVKNDATISSILGSVNFTNLIANTENAIEQGITNVKKGLSKFLGSPIVATVTQKVSTWYNSTAVQTALNSFNVGGNLNITAKNDITNTNSQLNAKNININSTDGGFINKTTTSNSNQQASLTAEALTIQAKNDITNTNSKMQANNIHISSSEGGFTHQTTVKNHTQRSGNTLTYVSDQGQQAGLTGGNIIIDTKKDINILAADITADQGITLQARNGAVNVKAAQQIRGRRSGDTQNFTLNKSITHKKSNLIGGAITILADKGILLEAANLKGDNVQIASNGDVQISTVTDSTINEQRTQRSHRFHSDSITHTRNTTQTTQTTNIQADNLDIQSGKGSLKLKALQANVVGDISLSAKDDIELSEALAKNTQYSMSSSSSGMERTTTTKSSSQTKVTGTTLNAGGDVSMQTKEGDITLTATQIQAANNIDIDAAKDLKIQAAVETTTNYEKTETSGLGMNDSLYGSVMDAAGSMDEKVIASNIQSGGKIRLKGKTVTDVGSNYASAKGMDITSTEGNIQFLTAAEKHTSFTAHEETSMDLNLAAMYDPSAWDVSDSAVNASVATVEKKENRTQTATTKQIQGSISSGGDISMDSDSDITLQATNLASDETIKLKAKDDVNIIAAHETTSTDTMDKTSKGELKVGVTHTVVQLNSAIKAVDKAKRQVDDAKQALDTYEDYRNKVQSDYAKIKSDYESGAANIDKADVDAFYERLLSVEDDRAFHAANIAAATVNLSTKVLGLAKQTAATAASAGTAGFSGSLTLDMETTVNRAKELASKAITGSMQAQNIQIDAGETLNVTGAQIAANNVNINANEVNIKAAQSTTNRQNSSKTTTANINLAFDSNADFTGGGISGSTSDTKGSSSSTSYTNASINANNLNINSKQDTTIAGANLHATNSANLNVGGDLKVISLQDTQTSKSRTTGISGGVSGIGSGGSMSGNVGGNFAKSDSDSKKVNNQTSITFNGNLNINTNGDTELKGSLLATKDVNGNDLGQLNLNTKTLTISNIVDTSDSKNLSANLSVGLSKTGSSTVGLNSGEEHSYSKTLATLGGGNINVKDTENSSDLSKVNRDITNTTKDIYDVKQVQAKVDMEVDHRVFSKEGRADIAEDIKISSKVTDTIQKVVTLEDVSVLDFYSQMDKSVKQFTAYNDLLKENPELAKKLADPNLSLEDKQVYQNQFKVALETKLGYKLAKKVKSISTDEKGEGGKDIAGFISTENDNIYSNDKNQNSTEDTVRTLGQELAGAMQINDGVDITTNRDQHNNYQDSIAQDTVDDIAFSLANNGYDGMASTNGHVINNATPMPSIFNMVDRNNAEFRGLDKEKGDNSIYLHRNKVIATDGVNDNKVIDLSNYELIRYGFALDGIFSVAKIDQEDTSKYNNVYNLDNINDFETLRERTDMDYFGMNSEVKQIFVNGMKNTDKEAQQSRTLIQNEFGYTGLINNATRGVLGDVTEWAPNDLTTKDVLSAYQLQQLSPNTTVITHSAGNEDIYKANQVNALVGAQTPYTLISVGSPRSLTDLQESASTVGATVQTQINHQNDPVANGNINKDANYEVTYNPSVGSIFPFVDDLTNNHPFGNYFDNYVREELQKTQNHD